MATSLAAARDVVVEGEEAGPPESERVLGIECDLGIHEDVYGLLHRQALDAQRGAVGAVDPVVTRFPEAPAIRDERERVARAVLGTEDRGRRPPGSG